MIPRCEKLYEELISELQKYREQKLIFLLETEYCFHTAEKYLGMIREMMKGHEFVSIEEEVHFFKIIKPKFIAESDYASLLNFAGNFCPSALHPNDQLTFWKRQVNRLEKFKDKYREFYTYHSMGHTHLDTVYFTRSDEGDKTESNYEVLIGQLLARQRYAEYAEVQLLALRQNQ
jgi:hypothetical protein